MFDNNDLEVLSDLGLTNNQIRVYLALLKLGIASKAVNVFKLSDVARQDVYRILLELEQAGIVEKIIARPVRFRAIEPKKAVAIMIEKQTSKFHDLSRRAEVFANKASEKYICPYPTHEKDQLVLITKKQGIIRKIQEAIEKAQTSMDSITPSRDQLPWMAVLSESIKIAKNKGIKVREITETSNSNPQQLKTVIFNQIPNAVPKKGSVRPNAIWIFDKKEVILFEGGNFAEAPILWTNMPVIVMLAENYFETYWKKEIDKQLCL